MSTCQVDERSLHAPIACGNVTAIAYALSAIGQKTSVDDIFHTAQLPLRAVTDGNMTLADTFHTMVEVVQIRQLPVKVNTLLFRPGAVDALLRLLHSREMRFWVLKPLEMKCKIQSFVNANLHGPSNRVRS